MNIDEKEAAALVAVVSATLAKVDTLLDKLNAAETITKIDALLDRVNTSLDRLAGKVA